MQLPRFIRHLLVKTLTFLPSDAQVKKYSCVHGKLQLTFDSESGSPSSCGAASLIMRSYPYGNAQHPMLEAKKKIFFFINLKCKTNYKNV